ncbi:hypothetical protein BJF80_03235 [Serinicoccus sp. CUA-874]|uniref:hypothetical protein n=1 Tax=Serinicoccus sp. CUA-874 TaxID=1517939 RepID=UPI00095AB138|nr:hypothetical protein [Serinicoccus sp. CUA-874]OLT17199.1 hypothetical protein BJF80_03235 [Serinicoccus sp. CUA-874]
MRATESRLVRDITRLTRRHAEGPLRRVLRAGASLVSADEAPDRALSARRDAQLHVSTGRRVAVVGVGGGAGASSTSVLLAQSLARSRGGGVALVGGAEAGALRWLNGQAGPRGPLTVLDEELDGALGTTVTEVSRTHGVTVVDCGTSLPLAQTITPHVLVLVARHTVRGLEQLDRTTRAVGQRQRVVPVLREVPDSGISLFLRRVDQRLRLPHDRHVAGEAGLSLDLVSEPTRLAVDDLAGTVVRSAVGA